VQYQYGTLASTEGRDVGGGVIRHVGVGAFTEVNPVKFVGHDGINSSRAKFVSAAPGNQRLVTSGGEGVMRISPFVR